MDEKTYDTILLPTGETTAGDESTFPVSRKVIDLYNSGRFGSIFITGGHGGFADRSKNPPSEAEVTRNFMLSQGVPEEAIYWDGQSLDTVGNFTFPIYEQESRNPNLFDFESILMVGQEGHMWRAKEYAELMPFGKEVKVFDIETIPGEHNNSRLVKFYHHSLMNVLNGARIGGPEKVHEFLKEEHPFYSEGWYGKAVPVRKMESMVKALSWYIK